MWLIVLIVAMFLHKNGMQLLNSCKPQLIKLLNSVATEVKEVSALKSENPVNSKPDEQHLLMKLEEQLISNVLLADRIPRQVDFSRWNEAVYPNAISLSDSAFYEVSRLIFCSNNLKNSSHLCDNITELVKDSLFGVKMENRIVFAFRMRLEATPLSATLCRIKLHEHFRKKVWPVLCKLIDFSNESREIIFTGYESGGSLASLAAWMTIKQFELVKPAGVIITNGNNQVKVITWDELPLFTHPTASKSPILPCNHARFNSVSIYESIYRQIAQSSGGIDEISYFNTSGHLIPIKSAEYADFLERYETVVSAKSQEIWEPVENLPKFIKSKNLTNLDRNRIDKLASILLLHRKHLSILHHLISNNYRSYITNELLSEPNALASALADQLSNTIFPGSNISCRIDNFNLKMGTFKIYCSYLVPSSKRSWSQFLSFEAVLGDNEAHANGNDCLPFTEEVEVPIEDPYEVTNDKESKKKKKSKKQGKPLTKTEIVYPFPLPESDNWSNCINELFKPHPRLFLILPFNIRKRRIHPYCSYIPFPPNTSLNLRNLYNNNLSNKRITGCYVVAPNISVELLQVYRSDPGFFYRLVDPNLMPFPDRCKKILVNIPFKANERYGLEALQQVSVEYLTQLVSNSPIANTDVTLWRQIDTEQFKTLAFFGTESIPMSALVNKFNYEPNFDNSIIKCLSNLSYPYRDCTKPINQWVPGACPAACRQTHGSINFLCKYVKNCLGAGYYVSVSKEGTLKQVSHIHEQLNKHANPQFGIFHVEKKGLTYFDTSTFNVALFRIPSEQQ
jgi:hypothetical protein